MPSLTEHLCHRIPELAQIKGLQVFTNYQLSTLGNIYYLKFSDIVFKKKTEDL